MPASGASIATADQNKVCWVFGLFAFVARDGACSVMVHAPPSSKGWRIALISVRDTSASPSHTGQISRGEYDGHPVRDARDEAIRRRRNLHEGIQRLRPVPPCLEDHRDGDRLAVLGVTTHCFVLPLGSSSPSLKVCIIRIPRLSANACPKSGACRWSRRERACVGGARAPHHLFREAPPHRHQLTFAGSIKPQDLGKPHRRGDDNLLTASHHQGLRERVDLCPRRQLRELPAHRCLSERPQPPPPYKAFLMAAICRSLFTPRRRASGTVYASLIAPGVP